MTLTATRQHLLQQARSELQDRLARIRRDRNRVDGALDPDFAEQAVQRENDPVLDQLESHALSELGRIEHALAHLDQGMGDRCESCRKTISRRRLTAVPHATLCARCSEAVDPEAAERAARHPGERTAKETRTRTASRT